MNRATAIIAAWNAEATLTRAVESCLAQSDMVMDVLVIDDASTDGTVAVAQQIANKDARVQVICQPQNGGPAAARNAGFAAARGDWIAVLDADDTWAPGRMAAMTAAGADQKADVVYDNLQIVDAQGQSADGVYLTGPDYAAAAQWDLPFFLARNQARPGQPSLGYLKPVFRRDFVAAHQLRYPEDLRNGEDFHIMLEALRLGAVVHYIPSAGYRYTTGADSISNKLNPDHAKRLIAAADQFIADHRGTQPAAVIAMMKTRRNRIADLTNAEIVMRSLKAKKPGGAAKAILQRPRSLPRLGLQIGQALTKRLF